MRHAPEEVVYDYPWIPRGMNIGGGRRNRLVELAHELWLKRQSEAGVQVSDLR